MVMELHVWGPAFGLPSIDPECIAIIAYFNWRFSQSQWNLVANYDQSISPQHEFPLLIDAAAKRSGFSNIVSYLEHHCSELGSSIGDVHLSQQQVADRTALAAFIQATAGPLVDLSLYISSENYNTITSSAYTAILPWYLNYTLPPRRRDIARSRTAHLGLSSLEISAGQNGRSPGSSSLSSEFERAKRDAGMPAEAPVLNMGRRSGIQGLLSGPVYAARFRLDALINELLEPLEHILKKHRYLLGGEEPASLDFLAFGYLSLMLYPLLPQAWLQKAMYDRFPCVVDYIKHMRKDAITLEDTNPSNVWAISQDDGDRGIRSTVTNLRSHLPWRPIQRRPLSFAVTTIARKVASVVPFVSIVHKEEPHIQNDTSTASRVVSSRLPSQSSVDVLMGISAAIVAALAAMAIQHRRSPREGNLIFWALRPQAQGLGEARNLLSVLAGQMSMPVGL